MDLLKQSHGDPWLDTWLTLTQTGTIQRASVNNKTLISAREEQRVNICVGTTLPHWRVKILTLLHTSTSTGSEKCCMILLRKIDYPLAVEVKVQSHV